MKLVKEFMVAKVTYTYDEGFPIVIEFSSLTGAVGDSLIVLDEATYSRYGFPEPGKLVGREIRAELESREFPAEKRNWLPSDLPPEMLTWEVRTESRRSLNYIPIPHKKIMQVSVHREARRLFTAETIGFQYHGAPLSRYRFEFNPDLEPENRWITDAFGGDDPRFLFELTALTVVGEGRYVNPPVVTIGSLEEAHSA